MQAVWNIIYPTRISLNKTIKDLLPSGQEFYGTVMKSSKSKTCVVQVNYKYWHKKYKKYFGGTSQFKVHDEDNFCVVGDKHCQKLTPVKYYYIRNVVVPGGRNTYYKEQPDEVMQQLQEWRNELMQKQNVKEIQEEESKQE